MYLTLEEMQRLTANLCARFKKLALLVDCYTSFAAKMSKIKNPINDVGVREVYGIDDPKVLERESFVFEKEHVMTPQKYVDELKGIEKAIFEKLYAGNFPKKLYRLYTYKKA